MLPKVDPTTTTAWKKLASYYAGFKGTHMKELFEKEKNRFEKYSLSFEDMLVDFSKNRMDEIVWGLLVELAHECGLKDAIGSMFAGQKINATEDRAVLHVALRNRGNSPV